MTKASPLDIAIVGMACRFPGAGDVCAFWENIVAGHDAVVDVPADRWDPAVFFDPESQANDRVYCKRGGYLDKPIPFDPAAHGIMPAAVDGGEPEQFLVLDAARAALADAGMAGGVPDRRRVEVVIGRGNDFNRGNLTRLQHGRVVAQTLAILRALHPEWSEPVMDSIRADLKASLPPFGPATVAGQLTNTTAGRVANRLDLSGASFVVDAASASSLVALDLGARALAGRRADLALVGAVYLQADVDFPMVFCQLGALSRSGVARPFGRDADGTLPGEGVGIVVLKRLADAERDGDRVYAVVKGVGLASDGRGFGLAAPGARGHARAIRRAYRDAGVDPATVGLIEGHGLGVPASDRAELRALRAAFPPSRRRVLGAVSSMIGHAMPAAGMAGLIKTALALYHRVLPPTLHADAVHPLLADQGAHAVLNRSARPWIQGEPAPRRAGVNAFGFSGINAHAVLEEHAGSADGETPGCQPHWDSEAILLGAPDRATWLELARALLGWLGRGPDVALKDLAYTLNAGQPAFPFRVGMVVTSLDDLEGRLRTLAARLADPACRSIRDARGTYFQAEPMAGPGRLAFLFPGEGSQYPGMLADLCRHFPEVRAQFDTADGIALRRGHALLPSDHLFGGGGEDGLWTIGTAVNAVLSAQWALFRLLTRLGLRPDAVAGHSSGELLAMAAAGVLRVDARFQDRLGELGAVFERLEGSGDVPAATLVAVAADCARVESACREAGSEGLTLAMDNCPHQVVLAGPPATVEAVVARLRGRGVVCETLPFSRAYHTPAFATAVGPVRAFFADLPMRQPRLPLYSCAIAGRVPGDVEAIRALAVDQWTRPVAFRETVGAMHADGVRLFVEVGARGNLTGFVEDTLRDRPHFAVAANLPRRSGLAQLNHLVAALFAHGAALRTDPLYARRRPERIDLAAEPRRTRPAPALAVGFPEMRISAALAESLRARPAANGHAARVASTNGHVNSPEKHLRVDAPGDGVPASRAAIRRATRSEPELATLAAGEADGAMLAYLTTMEAFLTTQREVMGAYWAAVGEDLATEAVPEAIRPHSTGDARSPTSGEPESGPWVGTVRMRMPGRELVTVRMLEAAGDPVAENHTLGSRRVSAVDPTLKGLPVVPFVVMAEMLAQAAAMLAPGRALVALRDVQAHRWIKYEEEPVALEIRARCDPSRPDEVRVEIANRGTPGSPRDGADGPVVDGTAVFAAVRPAAPGPGPFELIGAGPCRFTAEALYEDQWLFHGPPFQALTRVGLSAPGGIEGTLRVLPRRGLLRAGERGALLTDAVVLDAFTHLLGCWGLDRLAEGDVMFPLRMAELALFGADPPEGSEVACRIVIRTIERHRVGADAELLGQGGRVWMRVRGWEDWRFYWPSRYRDQFRRPDRVFLGEPLALAGSPGGACAVWLEPPADMGRPVWSDVLEWDQLGPAERAECRASSGPDGRKTLRLWGRIAAKEAARRLWADLGSSPVYPADLAIAPDLRGRPRLRSLLEPGRADLPAVSIAHAEGVAVALAALDPSALVGIDVERVVDRGPGFERLAFDPGEVALLDRAAGTASRAEWAARLWCAKEAAAKATGLGLVAGPASVAVVGLDPDRGEVAVGPGPALRAAWPLAAGAPVRVVTDRRGDYVWGWMICTTTNGPHRPIGEESRTGRSDSGEESS